MANKTKSRTAKKKKQSFKFRWWMGILVIAIIAVVGLVILRFSQAGTGAEVVKIYATTELGPLQNTDPKIIGRDGGLSGLVGGQPFWTFGDTFYNTSQFNTQPKEGDNYRSLTGGYGVFKEPTKVIDPVLPPNTLPVQVVPFTTAELEHNRNPKNPDIIVNWPAGVIPIDLKYSYVFFNTISAVKGQALNYTDKGNGVAKLEAGKYVAERLKDGIYVGNSIQYEFRQGNDIYFSACRVAWLAAPCRIGKVDYLKATDALQYRWWDGNGYQSDINKASDVVDASTTGMGMAYNPFLRKYTMVYSTFFEPNTIKLRTADRPEGPWSEPQNIHNLPAPPAGASNNYAVEIHPEFDQSGKELFVSYLYGGDYKIHLVQIKLAPPSAVTVNLTNPQSTAAVTQSYGKVAPCNIQNNVLGNKDVKACIVEPSTPINIRSGQFQRFTNASKITICLTAFNTDQRQVIVNVFGPNSSAKRVFLTFGSEGVGKILACGELPNPGSFESLTIYPASKIFATKLTIAGE